MKIRIKKCRCGLSMSDRPYWRENHRLSKAHEVAMLLTGRGKIRKYSVRKRLQMDIAQKLSVSECRVYDVMIELGIASRV